MAEGHRNTAKVEEVKGGHSEQGTLQTNSVGNEKVMVGVGQHWRDFKDCCLGRWMALLNRQWTEEKWERKAWLCGRHQQRRSRSSKKRSSREQ